MSAETACDVIVIGAGAGGLCAAARLVATGKKVLVVEARDRVGGRASSEQIDGFTVNVGAIAIELGGVFEQTFAALGVPLDLREPNPATVFRIDGKVIDVAKGGWGVLLGGLTKQAAKIGAKFADARAGDLPEAKVSTEQWLSQYTDNETVHAIFRNLCAAIFAANANELPARAFLTYFAVKGAFKRFGFCPRGTIGLWNDLADAIRSRGSEIWLNAPATALHTSEGRVTALDITKDGVTRRVSAGAVIGNIGPRATVALPGAQAFGHEYIELAQRMLRPAANIVINFATRERLIDVPGLVTFGRTRRLCNLGELTATCPELAPAGWYQYVAYAVPKPALGDFDEASEVEAALQDLRDEFAGGFAGAKMLSVRVMRDDWPAQRSCAGFDLPQDTPLANFWHVGDAVKDYGDGGTQACAETARIASQRAIAWLANPLSRRERAPIEVATRLLARLRPLFDSGVAALASACATDGKLRADRLDERQVVSFELAWAGADLLAAETAVAGLGTETSELDTRLALLFVADAITAVLPRLETLYLEVGLDLAPLQAFTSDPEWAAVRLSAAGAQALAAAGRALARADGECGRVALDEPLTLAQDAFRRFAAEVVAPQAEAIHRHDHTVPEALLQPMREMGVFGLSIPERYGGSGPNDRDDTLMMVVVTEALSEASLAAAGSLITRPEILSRALMAGGTDEQKARWLPQIAAGQPLCAIAITEPDYGSDVASLSLKGTRTEGGWRLDGAKTWCTFAGKAGVLMVVVRTDPDRSLGHRGLSVLLVEKPSHDGHAFEFRQPAGGRLVGKAIPTIGYRGMHSFDLAFENFFVPDANVVGGEAGLGRGFYLTMTGMTGGRMQTAARACGVMRAALLAALRYAGDRKVFGAPLLDFPLTLSKLARMAARYAACRQLAYAVGRRLDAGGSPMQASLVKLIACRSAEWVTREALQIHGGMGYAEESAVSRYFVDARVLSIFEGAEETLALKVIARSLLEDALASRDQASARAEPVEAHATLHAGTSTSSVRTVGGARG